MTIKGDAATGVLRQTFPLCASLSFVCAAFSGTLLWAVPASYSVRTLASQIPTGEQINATAASNTPQGVEIVGVRGRSFGSFDSTPISFPTSLSPRRLMQNPPSDSTQGLVNSAAYSPSLGMLEAGQYYKQDSSVLNFHAVLWNGAANPGVDLHAVSDVGSTWDSSALGVSATPSGYQAVGWKQPLSDFHKQAVLWKGSSPTSAQLVTLHNATTMVESTANGAYVYNGVAKQVGYSSDKRGATDTSPPQARVWSGSATGSLNLTPLGMDGATLNAGNGDGPTEILSGNVYTYVGGQRPAVWFGVGGNYAVLDTTPARPNGDVTYAVQMSAVGYTGSRSATGLHATLWDLQTHGLVDLHAFLPAAYQNASASSQAFFIDSVGNIYGEARSNGADVGIPVIWTVPEPVHIVLLAAALVGISARHRQRASQPMLCVRPFPAGHGK